MQIESLRLVLRACNTPTQPGFELMEHEHSTLHLYHAYIHVLLVDDCVPLLGDMSGDGLA